MDLIKGNKKHTLKRKICISINLFLMKIYDHFRDCTGVKESTDKVLKEMQENKKKVAFVEENIPRVIDEMSILERRVKYLESRVSSMHNELILINEYAKKQSCSSIVELLKKYNLSKELEY